MSYGNPAKPTNANNMHASLTIVFHGENLHTKLAYQSPVSGGVMINVLFRQIISLLAHSSTAKSNNGVSPM